MELETSNDAYTPCPQKPEQVKHTVTKNDVNLVQTVYRMSIEPKREMMQNFFYWGSQNRLSVITVFYL